MRTKDWSKHQQDCSGTRRKTGQNTGELRCYFNTNDWHDRCCLATRRRTGQNTGMVRFCLRTKDSSTQHQFCFGTRRTTGQNTAELRCYFKTNNWHDRYCLGTRRKRTGQNTGMVRFCLRTKDWLKHHRCCFGTIEEVGLVKHSARYGRDRSRHLSPTVTRQCRTSKGRSNKSRSPQRQRSSRAR